MAKAKVQVTKQAVDWCAWFDHAIADIAKVAWTRMIRQDWQPLWLYYKPNGAAFGVFAEGEDTTGWELVTGEKIRGDLTQEQLARRFHNLCSRLPVFPLDR